MLKMMLGLLVFMAGPALAQNSSRIVSGIVIDEKNAVVANVLVTLNAGNSRQSIRTDRQGRFSFPAPAQQQVTLEISGTFIENASHTIPPEELGQELTLRVHYLLPKHHESIVITATDTDPAIEHRNAAIYKETLFSRDDQIFDTLAAGINAGQHEGGGKSIEVRRFGFNLDHGGLSGGLKVLVDDIQQNQSTQGHGQGYLGQLKSLTPELIEDVEIVNGPFSAQYGDFSGLGVVHIRLKERLRDRFTARLQRGSFDAYRTFLGYSPRWQTTDSFVAYEGAHTNGPFDRPLHYTRHNLAGNLTQHIGQHQSIGFKLNLGRNHFDSSGQIPLDQVQSGLLDRFGVLDPADGGHNRNGTLAVYYKRDFTNGDIFKIDGFLSRSLFDLWSNFTFYLNDRANGDEIQQHDSRLQEGLNVQHLHPWKLGRCSSLLVVGANFHDNQIYVGLFPTKDRKVLTSAVLPQTAADARVSSGAGYIQQAVELVPQKLRVELGMRMDYFRFEVADRLLSGSGNAAQVRWQPKANVSYAPSLRVPLTLHFSYGRGISSQDARGVAKNPEAPKLATTDFYQFGTSYQWRRVSLSADMFLIDRSHEQVYIPDDGSLEFKGPSRSYGWEAKSSVQLTKHLSLSTGMTQVANAFYRGTFPRVYVDSAPHTVGNAGITLAGWHGVFGSLRYRHISAYRLDGLDPSIRASGLDVIDLSSTIPLHRGLELNFGIENLSNKKYWETQNYFESRLIPAGPAVSRIHGTPGYPIGITVGLTWRRE